VIATDEEEIMMTRREMTQTLGASFAALMAGAVTATGAKAAEGPAGQDDHDAQDHATSGTAASALGQKSLINQSITGLADFDAEMILLTLPPKFASGPHRHSGPVFAYVIEGTVENQVDPEDVKKFSAGDSWFELAMHTHRVMHNPSDTAQAQVLAILLTPKGKPETLR
jgi:quercetin dioxygenase-like cupin family protein